MNSHDNFYRTYDPNTGRYLEADPIGQFGLQDRSRRVAGKVANQVPRPLTAGSNLFAYALNDPISFADPTGESPALLILVIYAALAVDVAVNVEVDVDPETGEAVTSIPPPSMWDEGLPLPFVVGLEFRSRGGGIPIPFTSKRTESITSCDFLVDPTLRDLFGEPRRRAPFEF